MHYVRTQAFPLDEFHSPTEACYLWHIRYAAISPSKAPAGVSLPGTLTIVVRLFSTDPP
ncbi:hypothetical protein Misp01_26050 [Microtetraspora sp. NBRC 13810]|nr:hypothetical protein Misp01_26050 [Microtetraspora sp. NBRC 13810]